MMSADLHDAQLLTMSQRGDGCHKILKIEYRGRPVVLKCYGLKRGRFRTLLRQFGSKVFVGKSSITPFGRYTTEKETLALWLREGFDVPRIVPCTIAAPQPFIALEWIQGKTVAEILLDEGESLDFKEELVERFTKTMAVRHERALKLEEPRLIFEHPGFNHLICSEGRLVHFDFEIVFTWKRDLERLVRREIAGFLKSLARRTVTSQVPGLMQILVDTYPEPARLERILDELKRFGTVPILEKLQFLEKFSGMREKRHLSSQEALAQALQRRQ